MTILFFTKGDASVGSSRQRVWFLAEHLKAAYGYDYDIVHSIGYSLWIPSLKRFQTLKKIYRMMRDVRYKILYIHKSLFPLDIILLVLFAKWRWGKKCIYDLDDAEWIHSPLKSRLLAKNAHTVIAGSHAILTWAKQYNARCVLIPTALDYDRYARSSVVHAKRETATIGWTGSGRAHFRQGNFTLIKPALEELAKRNMPFRFVIIGAQHCQPLKNFFRKSSFETIFIDALDWAHPESIPQAIEHYAFDIGLMPLTDTLFNRAKCAFKAIEYMACGVPVVASNVGENAVAIKHGKTGLLVNTKKEWVAAMETLLADLALRKEMGETGQKRARVYYSYEAVLPFYRDTLQ